MRRSITMAGLVLGFAAAALLIGGCKQDQPKRKYIEPIEGTALNINTETGEVSMEFVHPETNVTMRDQGYVNEKTQVQINGVTARIQDVRVGDTVRVTGYREGPREDRKIFVTSINVRRASNNWLDTDGGGASQPAGRIESGGTTGSKAASPDGH